MDICFEYKAFKLYNPTNSKVIIRRDVVFDENTSWKLESNNKSSQDIMEDEFFPSEKVSQSLDNIESLTNTLSHSLGYCSDTSQKTNIDGA